MADLNLLEIAQAKETIRGIKKKYPPGTIPSHEAVKLWHEANEVLRKHPFNSCAATR